MVCLKQVFYRNFTLETINLDLAVIPAQDMGKTAQKKLTLRLIR